MDLLTLAYSLSGLVFGAAFIPQIVTLLRDSNSISSINISTWTMFSACSAVNFLYALVHNGDGYFVFCSIIGALGNISILSLACAYRFPKLLRVTARANTQRHASSAERNVFSS